MKATDKEKREREREVCAQWKRSGLTVCRLIHTGERETEAMMEVVEVGVG